MGKEPNYNQLLSKQNFKAKRFGKKNGETTLIATCRICGTITEKFLFSWKNGTGCKVCYYNSRRKTLNDVIKECIAVHSDKYDYSHIAIDYKGITSKVIVKCPIHGNFKIALAAHLYNSQGCPHCKKGFKGEIIVSKFFEKENIAVEHPKRFPDCKYKNSLSFDFYLPDYKTCVEYDGLQHYQFVEIFHRTIEKFEEQQIRDRIKDDYCLENGIKLIRLDSRIYHDESTIFEKLKTEILG